MPHMLHAWMLDPAGRRNLWCFSIFLCHLKQREENRRVSALSCFDDFEGSFLGKTDEKRPKDAKARKKTHTHKTHLILIHLASLYTHTHHGQRTSTLNDIVFLLKRDATLRRFCVRVWAYPFFF